MRPDLLFDNFNLVTEASDGIPKMREMILQLAVQGKLVPQDPNDEHASELLKRISAEKERLAKEGKIKKSKPLPPVDPDEVPYELPVGWEWVRLGEIQTFINGYAFKSADYQNEGVGIVRIGDISNGQISKHNMKYVSFELADSLDPNLFVQKNDLLIAMSGATTGKLGLNRTDEILILNQRVGKFDTILINKEFLYFYLNTRIKENLRISAGSAIQNLSTKQINNTFTPLPPIKEQERIVEKVDQLMTLCDQMEAEKEKTLKHRVTLNATAIDHLLGARSADEFDKHWHLIANNFDLLYDNPENVQKLRQAILQLAVSGKLIPQDPSDEPSSELLKRIKAEKDRLIKEGKIKKPKSLTPVEPNEVPYELPEGWAWTRLGTVGLINPRNSSDDKSPVSFVPMTLIPSKYGETIITEKRTWGEIKSGYTHFAENDVVLAKITPCFQNGKSAVMKGLENGIGAGTTELHVFRRIGNTIVPEYVLLYLKSPKFIEEGIPKMTGSAGQKRVPKDYFSQNPFPLPPIEEQKRIILKANHLMNLCDQMEAYLENSSSQADTLFNAIAEQVTASSTNSAYVN